MKNKRNKIYRINPQRDKIGRYIPYCEYHWHRGVVAPFQIQTCLERKCVHLVRLYFGGRELDLDIQVPELRAECDRTV